MIAISVRPSRASHDLIAQLGEFVVNIPWPEMELVSDFVGSTTARETDKWRETGLTPLPSAVVRPPLLAECPVNLECRVQRQVQLPSHTLFVAEVVAMHAAPEVLNEREEVVLDEFNPGIIYRAAVVRERPVDNFRPDDLRQKVNAWRDDA